MANPGYRPRVYGSRRTGSEWLSVQERKMQVLRKDADESVAALNEPPAGAVGAVAMKNDVVKKFEVVLDPRNTESLASVVKRSIETVFDEFGGNKAKTAAALGIGRTTIYRKMGLRKD